MPGDPTTHFFEQILNECFLNQEYVVPMPPDMYYSEFPEEEKGSWDPNHPSTFDHERSAIWLRGTWEDYVKHKYKKALDKWNKDTGGGDGSPTSFVDYCGGDRWLVWLFCLDLDANFLLACSAGGRMPKHLQIESGFTEEMSSLGEDNSSGNTTKRSFEEELSSARKQRVELKSTMERVVSLLDKKEQESDNEAGRIKQVTEYSKMIGDSAVLETMSPDSKDVYVSAVKKKRKFPLQKMSNDGSSN